MGKQLTKQDVFEIVNKSNQFLLEAINDFSTKIDQRFNKIESTMVTKDDLKTEFAKFETRMVSKDYLDQKLSDLRGDLIGNVHQTDKKLTATLDLLATKKVVTKEEVVKILSLEPSI